MKTLRITEIVLLVIFTGIIAKLRAMALAQAPVGYQDDTGFHFGQKDS